MITLKAPHSHLCDYCLEAVEVSVHPCPVCVLGDFECAFMCKACHDRICNHHSGHQDAMYRDLNGYVVARGEHWLQDPKLINKWQSDETCGEYEFIEDDDVIYPLGECQL